MTAELIMAIAMLCQVGKANKVFAGIKLADKYQLICQKAYIECVDKQIHEPDYNAALWKCVQKRKVPKKIKVKKGI